MTTPETPTTPTTPTTAPAATASLPRDLITVGVFAAIYFVIHMIFNAIGFVAPVLQPIGMLIAAIVNGIPFMIFLSRVRRVGMITLFAVVVACVIVLMGHNPVTILTGLVFGALGELIIRGGRRSAVASVLGYGVLSLWASGEVLPLLFMREEWMGKIRAEAGPAYADQFDAIMSNSVIGLLIAGFFVAAVIGGVIGRRVFQSHFRRAGIA